MMAGFRQMHFTCAKGNGQVVLQWPDDIDGADLEDAVACINMQVNTIRRMIGERERAARELKNAP